MKHRSATGSGEPFDPAVSAVIAGLEQAERRASVRSENETGRTSAGIGWAGGGCDNGHPPRWPSSADRTADRVPGAICYFKCFPTSLVISNMLTVALPPKTVFSVGSALIIRLFLGS